MTLEFGESILNPIINRKNNCTQEKKCPNE